MTSGYDLNKNYTKISLKPSTLLAPVPVVLVSCQGKPDSDKAKPNLITVAWAGTINSEPPMVSISVRKSRYSHSQIIESQEFVINLVDESLLKATDYCGVRSGVDHDKFKECQLTAVPVKGLEYACAVQESPLNLACKVRQVIELDSHDVILGEVTDVTVRGDLFDHENRLCLDRARLVAYAHGNYYQLGRQLGFFGYSVAREKVLKKRMPRDGSNTQSIKRSRGR